MLSLRKIAITGSLASGKTTVCRILKDKYRAYVVDADEIVTGLLSPETSTGKKVIELLGSDVIHGNLIDKTKVSKVVFTNPSKLKALENILHPAVRQEIQHCYQNVKDDRSYAFFVAEVALLFEAGMENDFDTVVAVVADEAVAKKRFKKPYFSERQARQMPASFKQAKADFVIQNNGDLNALDAAIQKMIDTF